MNVFLRWWRRRRDEWTHSVDRTAEEAWMGCAEWIIDMLDAGMDPVEIRERLIEELRL
jgi:hypothetical protein